jgi:hypothetical protein
VSTAEHLPTLRVVEAGVLPSRVWTNCCLVLCAHTSHCTALDGTACMSPAVASSRRG